MAEALEIKCATGVRYDKGAPNGNIFAQTNYSFIPISVGTVSPDSPDRSQPSWTLTHCKTFELDQSGTTFELFLTSATDERAQVVQNLGYYDSRLRPNN